MLLGLFFNLTKMRLKKIGVISDIHLRESMPYAECVADRREQEKNEILDFAVQTFIDEQCDAVVLNGDVLNSRVNSAAAISDLIGFMERLSSAGMKVIVIGGNHEAMGDGTSALDFLKGIKGKDWVIATDSVVRLDGDNNRESIVLCPYFQRAAIKAQDTVQWHDTIMSHLDKFSPADVLFIHHSISGCGVSDYVSTDSFSEPVLDAARLAEQFKCVIGGHIHRQGDYENNVHVVGSAWASEANDTPKRIMTVEICHDGVRTTSFPLPGRQIHGIKNATAADLASLPVHDIIRAECDLSVIGQQGLAELREALSRFDGYVLEERVGGSREATTVEGMTSREMLTLPNLLREYALARGIDMEKLSRGMSLVGVL